MPDKQDKTFDEAVEERKKQLDQLEHTMATIHKGGMMVGAFYRGMVEQHMPPELAAELARAFNNDFIKDMNDGRCRHLEKKGDEDSSAISE